MQANKTRFLDLIEGKKQFIIPVFQRDYCWTVDQCITLWEDLEKVKDSGHFFGAFVNVQNSGDAALPKWIVIDGQQRLTTLTLLMTALRDHLNEIDWSETPYPDQIHEEFLVNKFQEQNSESRFKLILRRVDDKTLCAYIEQKEQDENHSKLIKEAYECFRKKLAETQLNPNDLYMKVSNLELVLITLNHDDNPQFVFESLNSTGLDLSQSDLVRNFLLMGLQESEQTRLYENYWKIIEKYFRRNVYYTDLFLRDYLAIKKSSTSIKNTDIYEEFKDYQGSFSLTSEEILEDLLKYARHYADFIFPDSKYVEFPEELRNLGVHGDTHAILLMKLGYLRQCQIIDNDVYLKMLRLIDSYLLRRAVIGLETRSYWKYFASITHNIREDAPFDSFRVALALFEFPTDEEFRNSLVKRNLFGLRVCRPILDRLENYEQKREPGPTKNYSIEHIMPQNPNLNDSWQKMLGPKWKEVQEFYVHKLGNLTLTGYNQKLSDFSFEKKKITFNESAIRLNIFVREQEKWTEKEMSIRGEQLADKAIKIWEPLEVDIQVVRNEFIFQLKKKESKKSPQEIEMEPKIRTLFNDVHSRICEFGDIITLVERKSVRLYNPNFFVEMIPRTRYIRILMLPEVKQIGDPTGIVEDANQFQRLAHSDYNSYVDINVDCTTDYIFATVQIVRQAFEIVDK